MLKINKILCLFVCFGINQLEASNNENLIYARKLLVSIIDKNSEDISNADTLLDYLYNQDKKQVNTLLKLKDTSGIDLLNHAVDKNNIPMSCLLLQYGAKPFILDSLKKKALPNLQMVLEDAQVFSDLVPN
jgi:hypothetical protein